MDYLMWIDEQIAKHHAEMQRLQAARSVIWEANKTIAQPAKLTMPDRPKAKRKPYKPYRAPASAGATREKITNILESFEGQTAVVRDITLQMRNRHPEVTHKALSNALYNMRKRGLITHGERGYTLVQDSPTEH